MTEPPRHVRAHAHAPPTLPTPGRLDPHFTLYFEQYLLSFLARSASVFAATTCLWASVPRINAIKSEMKPEHSQTCGDLAGSSVP